MWSDLLETSWNEINKIISQHFKIIFFIHSVQVFTVRVVSSLFSSSFVYQFNIYVYFVSLCMSIDDRLWTSIWTLYICCEIYLEQDDIYTLTHFSLSWSMNYLHHIIKINCIKLLFLTLVSILFCALSMAMVLSFSVSFRSMLDLDTARCMWNGKPWRTIKKIILSAFWSICKPSYIVPSKVSKEL